MFSAMIEILKKCYYVCNLYRIWRPMVKAWSHFSAPFMYASRCRKNAANGIFQGYFQRKHLGLYIEHCLYFPAPSGSGGYIAIRGWLARKVPINRYEERPKYDLKIKFDEGSVITIKLNVERPDVKSQFPDTRLKCGFDIQIPARTVARSISVCSWQPLIDIYLAELTAYNVDYLISTCAYKSLTDLKKRKLDNLVLNEKERLHKSIQLQSNPLHFYIDPSFFCNLQCPHCHGTTMRRSGYRLPQLSATALDKILDEFGETLVQVYFANWGEPLLNKHFSELVRKMKKYEIWVHASTNLSLKIPDSRLDDIIHSGLDYIIVSVDGVTQDVYQRYRKNGNLELVLSNIRRLVNRKQELNSSKPVVEWQMLDFPWNRHQVEAAREMAIQIGVDSFRCVPGDIHESTTLSLGQRVDQGPMQMDTERHGKILQIMRDKQANFEYFGCDHLYRHLCIFPGGGTYPCYNVIIPEHGIGNIFLEGKENIVNGKYQVSNRGLFKYEGSEIKRGYDPCLNCELITANGEHRGHSFSALDFPVAFRAITGVTIPDFLDQGKTQSART
jgi:MoaA/NifB/PqqE/SkfB family radical SAM enzyme